MTESPRPIRNLGALLDARPDRNTTAAAIVADPDSPIPATTTYGSLSARVGGLARYLTEAHRPGERIGILGENSANYLTAILATARAGLVAVPLSPRQGRTQIAAIIDAAQPVAVFTETAHRDLLSPSVPDLPLVGEAFDQLDGTVTPRSEGGEATAVQLYTSGSSGQPKGVLLPHDAFLFTLRGLLERPAAEGLTVLVAAPLFHMNGLITCLSVLAQGGTIHLMRRFDAERYVTAIERSRPAVLVGVPTMFALAMDIAETSSGRDLSCVKVIISGSAPLTAELLERAKTVFPSAQLHNSYGTTEAFGIFGPDPTGRATPTGSVGVVQPAVEVKLVDGPTDQEGRLVVKTPASMTGYHNGDDSGRRTDGFYDTGDLARVDQDGFFYILGRADDLIICGGEKVYPTAVEAVLQSHQSVAMAAVVSQPDRHKGQVPVAFVVPAIGADVDPDELKTFTLEHGPAYAHPRRILILDELPMTSTGKIDKKRLTTLAGATGAA